MEKCSSLARLSFSPACGNPEAHRKNGSAEFYRGETARMLVQDMAALGGLITMDDLAQYQPRVREVLRAKYALDGHNWRYCQRRHQARVESP